MTIYSQGQYRYNLPSGYHVGEYSDDVRLESYLSALGLGCTTSSSIPREVPHWSAEINTDHLSSMSENDRATLGARLGLGARAVELLDICTLYLPGDNLIDVIASGEELHVVAPGNKKGTDPFQQFVMRPNRTASIGRRGDSEIRVSDPYISRQHATIGWDGERVSIRDLSTHGTGLSIPRNLEDDENPAFHETFVARDNGEW